MALFTLNILILMISKVKSELPNDMASQLRLLEWVPMFGNIFGGIFLGLGLILAVVGVVQLRRRRNVYV